LPFPKIAFIPAYPWEWPLNLPGCSAVPSDALNASLESYGKNIPPLASSTLFSYNIEELVKFIKKKLYETNIGEMNYHKSEELLISVRTRN
jgi:hypothetical protein